MTPPGLRGSHLVLLAAVLGIAVLLAAVSTGDAADTAYGAVAGATSVLLLTALVLQAVDRGVRRRARDRAVLDGLEPLGPNGRETA